MDITFYLDEIEAKIYGFLEKNANKAYTMFEIYLNMFVDDLFREEFRDNDESEDYEGHPLYQSIQKRLEKMVSEEKIAGKYYKGKFYYALEQ